MELLSHSMAAVFVTAYMNTEMNVAFKTVITVMVGSTYLNLKKKKRKCHVACL